MTERNVNTVAELRKLLTSAGLTVGLVVFLVGMRLLRDQDEPVRTLHALSTVAPVSLPAPPPPPQESEPPPPPPPDLPQLKLSLDTAAPAIKASIQPQPELRLHRTDFAPATEGPLAQMVFSMADLDGKPRLLNNPTPPPYPPAATKAGITKGRVRLEVQITAAGSVKVLRVLDSPHDALSEMAKDYATRARFTPPKKDGRAVFAKFSWPIDLKKK